jgi:hypothetical protein
MSVSLPLFAVLVPRRGQPDGEAVTYSRPLLVAVDDPAACQIVGAQLYDHAVLGEDADVVLAHLAGDMGKNLVTVRQLDAEHRVGESFDHGSFDLDDTVFFGHSLTVAKSSGLLVVR